MLHTKHIVFKSLLLTSSLLTTAFAHAQTPPGLVNVVFGTPTGSHRGPNGFDGGTQISETREGDLLVAGFADSRLSDTGGVPAKPMLTKFTANGALVWQQVYDRVGWSIIGMNASSKKPAVILWYPEPGASRSLDENHINFSPHGLIELWALSPAGELDRKLLTLNHRLQTVDAFADSSGFTLLLGKGDYARNDLVYDAHAYHYDWSGRKTRRYEKFPTGHLPGILLDSEGSLTFTKAENSLEQTALYYHPFSSKEPVMFPIENCHPCSFKDAVRNGSNVEILMTRGTYRDPDTSSTLTKYNLHTGKALSSIDLPAFSGSHNRSLSIARNGDLILLESSLASSVLMRFASDTRVVRWAKRFNIEFGSETRLRSIIELKDGRIAATGVTSSRPDLGSALLLITDSKAESIAALNHCLTEGLALPKLYSRLRREYRIAINTSRDYGFDQRGDASKPPVSPSLNLECPFPAESDIVSFTTALLETLADINAERVPGKTMISLRPFRASKQSRAYYYVPGRSSVNGGPAMLVDLTKAASVAKELAENALPYLHKTDSEDRFYQKSRQLVVNGNRFKQTTAMTPFVERDYALSPRDFERASRTIKTGFASLSESEKDEIWASDNDHYYVYVVPGEGSPVRHRSGHLELPVSSVESFWQWFFQRNNEYESKFKVLEEQLKDKLNIVFKQRPAAKPETYLSFLETLRVETQHLQKSAEPVFLEYNVKSKSSDALLTVTIQHRCTSSWRVGLDASSVAKWLENIWSCKKGRRH